MKKLLRLDYWFKGVIAAGLLLAMLLLVQSFLGYFHLSRLIMADQIKKEAEQQTISLERGLHRSDGWDPVRWQGILEEVLQDSSKKISGIRIVDSSGLVLVQTGDESGLTVSAAEIQSAIKDRIWISRERQTPEGKVILALLPIRIRPNRTATSPGQANAGPPATVSSGPRLAAMTIRLDSIAGSFQPLRQNLVISCLAALGLAASMGFLRFQFPRYIRGKQLEEQLELAHHVQTDLLPPQNSSLKNLDFAASCVAAWQVGGDFYDVFSADRDRTAFVLGDVSGKGIPAALLMGLLQGAVRSVPWWDTTAEHEASSKRLNDLLNARTSTNRFVSLFWGCYDPTVQLLRYVNAGHLPPALIRHQGRQKFQIQRLEKGGPILGVLPWARYRQGRVRVEPGDLLVMYSDGIVEATNAAGEEFGEERLWEAVQRHWGRSSSAIRDTVLREVHSFMAGVQPQDDMTIAVIRIEGRPEYHLLEEEEYPEEIQAAIPSPAFRPSPQWTKESFTSI